MASPALPIDFTIPTQLPTAPAPVQQQQAYYPLPPWATNEATVYEYFVFGYQPNITWAWVAAGAFFGIAVIHLLLTLCFARRAWVMYLASVTAAAEGLGYYYRIITVRDHTMTDIILMTGLTLVPPIILAIIDYEVVGKLLKAANRKVCGLRSYWVALVFLFLDIACFCIQAGCVNMVADYQHTARQRQGFNIILVGLVLQFVIFLLFAAVAVATWRVPEFRHNCPKPVARVLAVCLTTIGLLLVRNVYRMWEYGTDITQFGERVTTVVISEEWPVYAFDAIPVWLCHFLFAVFNFGWVLPNDAKLAEMVRNAHSNDGLSKHSGAGIARTSDSTEIEMKAAPGHAPKPRANTATAPPLSAHHPKPRSTTMETVTIPIHPRQATP